MSKNEELNTTLLHDEAQWRDIENEVSKLYPREATMLNALFVSRRKSVQRAQELESEGQRMSSFVVLLKTWLFQTKINKIISKLANA
jgi:hypothetical protein